MPDINTYALSLQLNLESNAPVVLEDVSTRLDRINEQISQIASNYDSALTGAAESLAAATEQIAESLDNVNQSLNQSWPIYQDMDDLDKERTERLEDQLETVEKTADAYKEMLDDTKELRADAMSYGNALDRVGDGAGVLDDHLVSMADNTKKVKRGFFDVFLGIEAIKTAFAEFLELEEDFITANYRLYGAQEEIVRQVNDLSDQYALLRGTAQEAMKSLAISTRVPREELGKYVVQVSMFHRATGASIDQTAEWTRSMMLAGFTSRDTERSLGRMVLMMRQAGFTTAQINKLLSQQTEWSALLASSYSKEGVEAFNAGSMAMAALTREVHGDADAMMALYDSVVRVPSAMELLRDYSDISADSLAGLNRGQRDVLEAASGMLNYFAEVDARTRGLDPYQAGLQFQAMGQVLGLTGPQMEKVNIALRAMREELDLTDPAALLARLKPMMDEFKAQNALMEEFSKSMNTVKAQWATALQPLFHAWINLMIALKPVMQFIINLVGALADVLAFLINTLAAIINPVAAFKRNLEEVNEAGEETVGFLKRLGTGVLNFAQALPGLIFGIAVLVGLYYGLRLISQLFINWVNQMRPANLMALASAFLAIGASMLMMATALAVIAALGWRAAGALIVLTAAMAGMVLTITFLANVARSATVPLTVLAGIMLAFGAAALMISGSLWVIAEAMKTMADLGWALVGAVVAVVAILGAMAGALLLMSTVGAPAVPLMLAVGAAFLMMGAAIWLTAAAFEMIVDSFGKLGESAMQVVENAGALFVAVGIISAALLALAAVGAITAVPLLALGIALLMVGAAATMIASAFEAAAAAVKAFADIENVQDAIVGMRMAITAMMFTMAGLSIVLAPVLPLMLVAAGVLLAVGAAAWLTAQAMDVMVGVLEKFGDMDMVLAGVAGIAVAMLGLAAVALVLTPVIPTMIMLGVAMMSIGAGAWLLAQGLSATVSAIQEFAEIDTTEILQVGWDLMAFGTMITAAARRILWGSLIMVPAAVALTYGLAALSAALWILPVGRLRVIGEAVRNLGDGFRDFVSSFDLISDIALRGDSFGELAVTLSSALDEIEEQALRADAIADSFVRMNEAIARALAGPPEPVYGDVAAALRDKMDTIEEQAARAEAVYAPIEGIAEQAELALAMSSEPAPEAYAEPVAGGLGPGTDDDAMAFSNYKNLGRQTVLLEEIKENMPMEVLARGFDVFAELKDAMVEYVEETTKSISTRSGNGMFAAAALRHAGEE